MAYFFAAVLVGASLTQASAPAVKQTIAVPGLEFIDTSFENASPLWYEAGPEGTVLVHLLYDLERSSPNRAAGHYHFRVEAKPGTALTLELKNLDNVWNGTPGSVGREMKRFVVSENGRDWESFATVKPDESRAQLPIKLKGSSLYVARVEPYRISDLDRLLAEIRSRPLVEITPIGKTVEGRSLEIVRVGRTDAPYRVFLRARAHPWEPGGNWVVQGLIRRLLKNDEHAKKCLERYCVYVLPMANKDGVAKGRTRFNMLGKDLNRNWDRPADPVLAPENHALEQWLEAQIKAERAPHLALELHNDGNGKLHISRPPVAELDRYLTRMKTLEQLLRMHTWFTEGSTAPTFRNSGTLGDGWLERYHVDALVHEFNANWVAGLEEPAMGKHWENYGENLTTVFYEYFGVVKP